MTRGACCPPTPRSRSRLLLAAVELDDGERQQAEPEGDDHAELHDDGTSEPNHSIGGFPVVGARPGAPVVRAGPSDP